MLKKLPSLTSLYHPIAQAALLLCASATAHAQTQAAPAATLEFVQGAVNVRSIAGQARAAQRGAVVANGETIETQNGRAQMRMIDGAFISLQNDTTLRLDNYRVANAGESESALMSLVRGGLRTVTGLIGRSNRSNYRLQTATATVGIRGTGYLATSGDEGTRVRVSEGAVALCTQGGCLDLTTLQSGFAPSSLVLPIRVSAAPVLSPAPVPSVVLLAPQPEQRVASVGQEVARQTDGLPPPPPPPPPPAPAPAPAPAPSAVPLTGTANGAGLVYSTSNEFFNGGLLGGSLTFDTSGRLLSFSDGTVNLSYSASVSNVAEFGSDGIVAWGRWAGGSKFANGVFETINHLTYFTGNTGAAVPIEGSYTVFASTAPVALNSDGPAIIGASNSVTGGMSVNFASSSGGTLAYNLAIPLSGQVFRITGSANQYAGTALLGSSSSITSTGTGCSTGCSGVIPFGDAIQGGFYGVGNTRAAAQYGFSSGIGKVTGAVVFTTGAID